MKSFTSFKRPVFASALLIGAAGLVLAATSSTDAPCPLSATDTTNNNVQSPEQGGNKVYVHHNTGNGSFQVICVSQQGANAHVAQHTGDFTMGPCTGGG